MRGGAIDPTVLAGLSNNTPYVCGSTRIDQATALGKTEAYNFIYFHVRGAPAGGRQAAITRIVTEATAVPAAARSIVNNYVIAHPNYVGLYKSGGNFYTVPIDKALGNIASSPNPANIPREGTVGPAAPPFPRVAIAAVGGAPGPLPVQGGVGPADYIIVEA